MSKFKEKSRGSPQAHGDSNPLRKLSGDHDYFDDDDSSGGGHGKGMLGSYKLEKLLNVIAKGKMKAQNFWRFLNKEGLDSYEVEKTPLTKDVEQKQEVKDKIEKEDKILADLERAQEIQERGLEDLESDSALDGDAALETFADDSSEEKESAWKKAPADDEWRHRFGLQDEHNAQSPHSQNNADAVRRNVMGDRTPGSIVSGTTNPLGFTRQVEIAGNTNAGQGEFSDSANMGRKAAFGDLAQGANYGKHHSDHQGTVRQSLYFNNPSSEHDRKIVATGEHEGSQQENVAKQSMKAGLGKTK